MIREIEVERFSLTTPTSFDEVVAGVSAAVGHPDITELPDQLTKRTPLPS